MEISNHSGTAVEALVESYRQTSLQGENSCGFVSPIGSMRICAKDNYICKVEFTDEPAPGEPRGELAVAVLWLEEYFAGNRPSWHPRCSVLGTRFSFEVGSRVCRIPYGETSTYKIICDDIVRCFPGSLVGPQAVSGTLSLNQLAIMNPCHRVIGSDDDPGEYPWGLERKKWLLEFEKRTASPIAPACR